MLERDWKREAGCFIQHRCIGVVKGLSKKKTLNAITPSQRTITKTIAHQHLSSGRSIDIDYLRRALRTSSSAPLSVVLILFSIIQS